MRPGEEEGAGLREQGPSGRMKTVFSQRAQGNAKTRYSFFFVPFCGYFLTPANSSGCQILPNPGCQHGIALPDAFCPNGPAQSTLAADQNHEPPAARHCCVEQVSLQHQVMLVVKDHNYCPVF